MAQRYDHTVDDAVLTMIKQYTKFISEFRNTKSSKDGTTSLAILSASLAKSVLMARVNNRKDKEKYMQVPEKVKIFLARIKIRHIQANIRIQNHEQIQGPIFHRRCQK